jgi:DNA-directed RNA polymerase specialized sigma24 family protein
MNHSHPDVRWDVMASLYEAYARASQSDAGNRGAEVIDRALSLSVDRTFPDRDPRLLVHAVRQNARYSVDRGRERARAAVANLALELGGRKRDGGVIAPEGSMEAPSSDNVEDLVEARDLAERVTAAVRPLGAEAMTVLSGMLAEESAAEIAARTGIPVRTVFRTRTRIRNLTRPLAEAA